MAGGSDTWVDLATDEVPRQATERYERMELLGEGGMGVVHALIDRRLQRVVAAKSMKVDAGPGHHAAFIREAQLTAGLEHPGVVAVYDADDGEHGPFYTMRRIEGKTLEDHLVDCTSEEQRLRLLPTFLRVLEAMAYVHSQQVIHRDLKPENIVVGAFGEAWIVDFGIAERLGEPRTIVAGTPATMSPEAARGERCTPASDVWSLGVILHSLLTGESLMEGDAESILERARTMRAAPTKLDGVRPELAAIAVKALQVAGADRYASAEEFRNDVSAYLEGRWVEAHTYSSGELVLHLAKRHRAPLIAGMAGLCAVAMVALLGAKATLAETERAQQAEREATEQLARTKEQAARVARDDRAAERTAREALAVIPTLPYARGILARTSLGGRAERIDEVDVGECGQGAVQEGRVVLHCGEELVLLDRQGQVLDRIPWPGGPTKFGAGPWAATAAHGDELYVVEHSEGRFGAGHSTAGRGASVLFECEERLCIADSRAAPGTVWRVDGGKETRRGDVPAGWPVHWDYMFEGPEEWALFVEQNKIYACQGLVGGCVPYAIQNVHKVLWSGDEPSVLVVRTDGQGLILHAETGEVETVAHVRAGGVAELTWAGGLAVSLTSMGLVELFHPDGSFVGVVPTELQPVRGIVGAGDRLWVLGKDAIQLWDLSGAAGTGRAWVDDGVASLVRHDGGVVATYRAWASRFEAGVRKQTWHGGAQSFMATAATQGETVLVGGSSSGVFRLVGDTTELVYDSKATRRLGVDGDERLWSSGYTGTLFRDGKLMEQESVGDLAVGTKLLLLEGANRRVELRRTDDLALVQAYEAGTAEVWALAISPQEDLVAFALDDYRVRLMNVATGEVSLLPTSHGGHVGVMRFSPDGRRVATGSWDGTLRVWDVEQRQLEAVLEGHHGRVSALAFETPDLLVSGSWDRTIRYWDLGAW